MLREGLAHLHFGFDFLGAFFYLMRQFLYVSAKVKRRICQICGCHFLYFLTHGRLSSSMLVSAMAGGYALIAFFGLTAIHVSAAILYKYSQSDGKYEYSPATTLVLAELVKILLSLALHCSTMWETDPRDFIFKRVMTGVWRAIKDAWRQVDGAKLGQLAALALSYTVYNQFQFLVFMWADAASVVLLRSSGSFIAAVMAYFLLQRLIVRLQWLNIVLQVFGLVLVQYDACRARTTLHPVMYIVLFIHVSLSSFNSIWNEHLVKSKDAPSLNVQNMFLYIFGASFNLLAYLILPPSLYGVTDVTQSRGFFHGYTTIAVLIVFLNSVIGLAITAVYKYADVIIKTFSLACATGTLFLVDYIFFGRQIGLNVLAGILIVYGASYLYFVSTPKPSAASTLPTTSPSSNAAAQKEKEDEKSEAEGRNPSSSTDDSFSRRDTMDNDRQAPRQKRKKPKSLACLFVPEFLVNNAPPKLTMVVFLVVYLLLSFYVSTKIGVLYTAAKGTKPGSAPLSLIQNPATIDDGLFIQSPAVENPNGYPQRARLPPPSSSALPFSSNVTTRPIDTNSNIDNYINMKREEKTFAGTSEKSEKALAVCFMDGTSRNIQKTYLRWDFELEKFSGDSYDKFLVHSVADEKSPSFFGDILEPVATISLPSNPLQTSLDISTTDTAARKAGWCHLDQFSNRMRAASACIDLIEFYMVQHKVSYQYVWIVEPDCSWTKKATLPKNGVSNLPSKTLHFRNSHDINDPTSLITTPKEARSFYKDINGAIEGIVKSGQLPLIKILIQTVIEKSNVSASTLSYLPSRGDQPKCKTTQLPRR